MRWGKRKRIIIKIAEALASDIVSKPLSKNFGKASDNVFEIYTKEIIKKEK